MKRRVFYGTLLGVLAVNLVIGAHIYFANVQAAEKDDALPNLRLFGTVLDRVRQEYVDGDKLSYQDLIHGALKGMLSTLDPHSEFMEPAKYDDLKKDTQGEFGGVGIVVSVKDNYITVVAPMEDTPGFRAGILTGDRIVKIDGKSAERMSLTEAVKRLRGLPDTDVVLTTYRPSTGQFKDHTLTRAKIKVDTVKDIDGRREFPLSENDVGYIRIQQFGEATSGDLEDALRKLESRKAEAIVLDLRDNPGGLLEQAVQVCEKFLPADQLIVSTEGRDAKTKATFHGKGRGKHPAFPLVVLVNNSSASASEIVAGCLQDSTALGVCKAIVVGEQTFGKGSVQSILPLQDGSALRLTTAKYYTPSHKVIHEHGITPDIIVPMSDEEMHDIALKRTPGGIESLPDKDQERVRAARDVQLERAMDLLKGISLYTKRTVPPERDKRPAGKSDKVASKLSSSAE
jgi:carboxyl-terminal processing protease